MQYSIRKGFTLIELLVVVVIIAILTGTLLVLINPAQLRARARDAQRVADVKYIHTALEQYFLAKRVYPVSASFSLVSTIEQALKTAQVVDALPSDPLGGSSSSPCTLDSHQYNYYSPAGNTFVLTAIMEVVTSNDGNECGRLTKWLDFCPSAGSGNCPGSGRPGNVAQFATCDYCYGVESQ